MVEFIRWKRLCRYRIPVADEQVCAEFLKVKKYAPYPSEDKNLL